MISSSSDEATELGQASTLSGGGRGLDEGSELPARIGRFVVVEKIGAGGMGVVVMAYDPHLDRRVAIKLMHPARSGDPEAQDRMVREAQALAKLSHPNVVQIYDVGTHADQVYLAMEFVQGETLEAWLGGEPPPGWREIVDMFVAAGEGLAAAHAAGLVHRDFKPHNALVGSDGRVRVLDFGLVRVHRIDDEQEDTQRGPIAGMMRSGDWQTKTGDVLGTPAFMAPEQFLGEPGDARTDQYNFCASLFRGLWGVRPHPGQNVHEIMEAALAGTVVARPGDRDVPADIEAAVLRGLAREPAERHPSLPALLDLLRSDPRGGRRLGWIAAGAIAIASAGVIALALDDEPSALDRCLAASGAARAGWEARRREIEAAFAATKLPYATDSFTRIDARMSDYAASWTASHEHACNAAHATATQSSAMLDLRVACLERARTQLDAAAEVLATADAGVMRRALRLADGLPQLSRCEDVEALAAAVPPPEDAQTQAAVAAVRERLAKAGALDRAGRFADAVAEARAAIDDAVDVDYPPVHVEAARLLADAQSGLGEVADAEAGMREAYWGALAGRLDEVAYVSAWRLVEIVGVSGQRFDEAQWWWQSADAIRRRIGSDANEEGRLIGQRALMLQLRGEHDDALVLYEQALALVELAALRLKLLNDRGDLYHRMGNTKAADAAFADAHAKAIEIYGEKHPDTALPLGNRGMIALQQEDYATAVPLIEQAIAVLEPAVAEGNPHLATMYNMLAVAAEQQGQQEKARPLYERALAIRVRAFGPEHADVAMIHANLGRLAWSEEHYEDAIAAYQKAVAIYEKALGPEHPSLAVALAGLASAYWELERLDDAIPPFERALAIQSRDDIDPNLRARTQFLLARTLWAKGDRTRATELAKQAHAILSHSTGASEPRQALAAWSERVGLQLDDPP